MDKQFWINLLKWFLENYTGLIIALIGAAIIKIMKNNNASKEQIALVDGAYEILARAARDTNQIWVDALKLANGSLTPEEQAKARADTAKVFKEMITEATKYAIEKTYGSIEKYIQLYLESAVNYAKDVSVPITVVTTENLTD